MLKLRNLYLAVLALAGASVPLAAYTGYYAGSQTCSMPTWRYS